MMFLELCLAPLLELSSKSLPKNSKGDLAPSLTVYSPTTGLASTKSDNLFPLTFVISLP